MRELLRAAAVGAVAVAMGALAAAAQTAGILIPNSSPLPIMGYEAIIGRTGIGGSLGVMSDQNVRDTAAGMIHWGLMQSGYTLISLDSDGWQTANRAPNGQLQASGSFPSGIAPVATYVHGLGMTFGLGEASGITSCAGNSSGYGYETLDAATFAAWGVDYIKWDQCCTQVDAPYLSNLRIAKGIRFSGRAMSLEAGNCTAASGPIMYATGAQSARIGVDLTPATWSAINAWSFSQNLGISQYAGPSRYFDMDPLMVGNGSITDNQGVANISIYAIQAAVLQEGNTDLRAPGCTSCTANAPAYTQPSATTIATLTNPDIIAIDQDPLGIAGTPISTLTCGSATCEVWVKPLTGTNTCAIGLFNRDTASHSITATFATIAAAYPQCGSGPYETTSNIWGAWPSCGWVSGAPVTCATSLGTLTGSYSATVPATGAVVIKIAP